MKIAVAIVIAVLIGLILACIRRPSTKNAIPTPALDTSTPEGAILCLEAAYRARDLEKAVALKDFDTEARLMLKKLQPKLAVDPDLVKKTAETLELAFRSEMQHRGFPDFDGVESFFTKRSQINEDLVEVTEVTRDRDGRTLQDTLWASRTPSGWRVVTRP